LLGDEEAAADLTHQVFLRIRDRDGWIFGEPLPMAWLYRLTTNMCLDQLRDDKHRTALLAKKQTSSSTPGGAAVRATVIELQCWVVPQLQEIAVYYYVDEMTSDEIAALMGMSGRSVSNLLLAFRIALHNLTRRDRTPTDTVTRPPRRPEEETPEMSPHARYRSV
jgi:RNA polymerase sigma-70 factor (ECF subfamily)